MFGKVPEWLTQRPSTLRKSRETECPPQEQLIFDDEKNHCCKMCPAGEFLVAACSNPGENSTCKPCEKGKYLEAPNYKKYCISCSHCYPEDIEISCTATSNTKCQCSEGRFKAKHPDADCEDCTECSNRETTKNCSETEDSICGKCWPGFYPKDEECRSCSEMSAGLNIGQNVCGLVAKSEPPVIFITTSVFIALLIVIGGLLAYCYRRKKQRCFFHTVQDREKSTNNTKHWNSGFPPNVILSLPQSQLVVTSPDMVIDIKVKNQSVISSQTPLLANATEDAHSSALQQGKTLYDIINTVPARRWKEFMRTLELNDAEIERVEVEFSYFREQQYEMIKSWTQQKNTTMELIYSALERMDLSGCAEELRGKFEECP